MSEYSEITQVYNAESNERLQKSRTEEILKIHKLELLLSILKSAREKDLDVSDWDTLRKSLKALAVQNYIKFGESDHTLNLRKYCTVELSYTEKKAVRELLIKKIPEICTPVVKYIESTIKNNSELYDQAAQRNEIINLEKKRRELHIQRVVRKNDKCKLLKTCTELKLGPFLRNELELMYANYKLNQVKANTLQAFLINEFCTRTEHAVKAIKEVEGYIDAQLDDKE